MAKTKGIQRTQPDFNTILDRVQEAVFSRLNCHNLGKVSSFNKETQTATIELMQIKQDGNYFFNPPPITNVPLIIYGVSNAHITLPDPTGSICLLFFNDRNMDSFLETAQAYSPETSRMHDITDCIAITTFSTLNNPIKNYDDKAISIFMKEIIEEVQYSSFIRTYADSIKINLTSVTKEEDEETITQTNINLTPSAYQLTTGLGANFEVSDKFIIQNQAQNLSSLIQEFITACENIATVNGGNLTPDSKQLFTDLKTKFEEILK